MLRGTSLALEEAAGEATHGGVFFLIINGKGHEVDVLAYLFLRADGGQKHGVVHAYHSGTVGLFGQLASLDFDHTAIAEVESLSDDVFVHFFIVFLIFRNYTNRSYSKKSFKKGLPDILSGNPNHNQINMKNYFFRYLRRPSCLTMAR